MLASRPLDLDPPVAVVCHDAGAANIILTWLEAHLARFPEDNHFLQTYLAGPALGLLSHFDLSGLTLQPDPESALEGARTLVAGTGWGSTLELGAFIKGQAAGLRCISVIDHWINYAERFVIGGLRARPSELWVTDTYALEMAKGAFPDAVVVLRNNTFLERSVSRIGHPVSVPGVTRVLYTLEPIRESWGQGSRPGEFQALDYFFENINRLGIRAAAEVCLRPHPSESAEKYRAYVHESGPVRVLLDAGRPLEQAIVWADIVVGCRTMAMVIALAARRRVVSSLPPWSPPCRLPHAGIEHLRLLI